MNLLREATKLEKTGTSTSNNEQTQNVFSLITDLLASLPFYNTG